MYSRELAVGALAIATEVERMNDNCSTPNTLEPVNGQYMLNTQYNYTHT